MYSLRGFILEMGIDFGGQIRYAHPIIYTQSERSIWERYLLVFFGVFGCGHL